MKKLFREHRGGLDEAMATLFEFDNRQQLLKHIRWLLDQHSFQFADSDLRIDLYQREPDRRIGWEHTYIVTIEGYGVMGFTNDPADHLTDADRNPLTLNLGNLELYAWVGRDEFGSGEIGLKQGMVPAGLIPMVSISRDKLEPYWRQAETQAHIYGQRIFLARFQLIEIVRATVGTTNVHLVKTVFNRWVIVNAEHPSFAWSGSQWVKHQDGMSIGNTQISNLDDRESATEYAKSAGFSVLP
jgi:hypothetical protein